MNIINLLTGIRFPVFFELLVRNGFSLHPKYLIRLLFVFQNSLISSVLILIERIRFSRLIRETVIAKPPVFIIGHWRTGSTFLHQLFNLDPQFTTPSTVQTVIPDHFLLTAKYYIPIMKMFTPKGRTMDGVKVLPTDPQEDEFALIRMGSVSPMEKLFFPSEDKYFLYGYDEYIPKGKKLEVWKQNQILFYKKITFLTHKQIVSKNPFHTMRMTLLAEIFPGARFIHISRSPFEVVPSTIRMWDIVAKSNSFKSTWKKPDITEVATVLKSYMDYVSHEKHKCGENQFTEVLFENLEKDPVNELRRIYSELNLEYSESFEYNVKEYLAVTKDYKKNAYQLAEEEKVLIRKQFENPDSEGRT